MSCDLKQGLSSSISDSFRSSRSLKDAEREVESLNVLLEEVARLRSLAAGIDGRVEDMKDLEDARRVEEDGGRRRRWEAKRKKGEEMT